MKSKKSLRWLVICITGITLALSAWAVSSPVASGPDDDFHLASIWCGQGVRDGLCEEGSKPGSYLVPSTVVNNAFCFAFQENESGFCPQTNDLVETSRVNLRSNHYPAVYYWTMSWLATEDVTSSVITMRLVNSAIAVSLLSVIVVLLPVQLRRIPIVSFAATLVPLGMFVIASTNPSGSGLVSIIAFFSAVLGLLTAKTLGRRLAFLALSGISFLLGAGAREDSAAYLIFSAGLAWFITSKYKSSSRANVFIVAGVSLSAILFLALAYSSESFIGYFLRGANWWDQETTLGGTVRNIITLPDLWVGVFGYSALGWLDTPLPSSVWAVSFSVFAILIFGAVRHFSRRQSFAVLAVVLALVFVPMYTLAVNGLLVGQIVQPRYLLPLLALLVATSMFRGTVESGLDASRGQLTILGLGLVAANAISLHTNLRRYLTGLDENQVSLNFEIEWWWFERPSADAFLWPSPNYVWVIGFTAFALFLFSLWKLRDEVGLSPSSSDASYQVPAELENTTKQPNNPASKSRNPSG